MRETYPHREPRPGIRALAASKIRELANAGMARPDAVPLWFGEPDHPTPDFIKEAAAAALRRRLSGTLPAR